jgi:hypothetical protein
VNTVESATLQNSGVGGHANLRVHKDDKDLWWIVVVLNAYFQSHSLPDKRRCFNIQHCWTGHCWDICRVTKRGHVELFFLKLTGWDLEYCVHYWRIVPAPDDR